MSESDADEQTPAPAQPASEPIPYATPGPRTNPGVIPVKGRIAIGCLGYILLSVAWFASVPYFERYWTIKGLNQGVGVDVGVDGWAAMTVGLLGIALWLRLKFGYRGYGYGILSAFGAAALLLLGLFLLLLAICGIRGR